MLTILPKIVFTSAMVALAACGFAQELEISLQLRKDENTESATLEFEESFEVTLRNISDRTLTVPSEQWADQVAAISFQIRERESDKSYHVYHKPKPANADINSNTRNGLALQPGESTSFFPGFAFDRWGEHGWQNLPAPNLDMEYELIAKLDTSEIQGDVWKGKIQSKPVNFRFVFERAQLPQQYLWNGFPDAALRMLKSDPSLIHQTDEDQRTPLHVAVRFDHPEVVRWLIENKADVNAVAYNRFTPLHMANLSANPAIYRLLLAAGANPHAKDAFGQTPQQEVAEQLADDRIKHPPGPKEKWREILKVFEGHGIKLDLITAIQLGRTETVKKILETQPTLINDYAQNQQPLRTAARLGHADIVQHLLQAHPEQMDVNNFSGGSGYPVIQEALKHPKVVQQLIDAGADLERRITYQGFRTGVWLIGDNATILHFAARDGVPETINLLLDKGVAPLATSRTDSGQRPSQTALDVACLFGKTENAIAILESSAFAKADANSRNEAINNCLTLACRGPVGRKETDRLSLVNQLFAMGADPLHKEGGQTLIQLVTRSIHPNDKNVRKNLAPIVGALVEAGVQLDLFSSVALRDQAAVQSLLAADPTWSEARRDDGYPAIHFAISCGEIEIVKMLINAGCDLDLKNHSKSTGSFAGRMMHVAAFWNQPEIAQYLIDAGAKVNVIAKEKVTPLHEAVRTSSMEMVKLLLENGADINAKDINGRGVASMSFSPQVKKLLREWEEKSRQAN